MRAALQRGTHNMKQLFENGNPGCNWVYGPDQLRLNILASTSNSGPVDVRPWQPMVPLLIRSYQLVRDILHTLPFDHHVALEGELYWTGLRTTLGLLIRLKGGTVWRFRCGLEVMKLALDPEGAVQRIRSLRDNVELSLLASAIHCMKTSIGK